MGLTASTLSNIKVGNLRQITRIDVEGSVYEIDGPNFPKFYFDHSNHVEKIDYWLTKIQKSMDNNMFPLSPAVLVDSQKSGKTALLTKIMPHRIREKFPTAIILFIDFLSISIASNHHVDTFDLFGKVLIEHLVNTLSDFGFNLKRDDACSFTMNITIQTRLGRIFRLLNVWLSKKKCMCFMIWDEIQKWLRSNNKIIRARERSLTILLFSPSSAILRLL